MFEALASFSRQLRGSIFCNVPLREVKERLCELEPFNANSIVLVSVADCTGKKAKFPDVSVSYTISCTFPGKIEKGSEMTKERV